MRECTSFVRFDNTAGTRNISSSISIEIVEIEDCPTILLSWRKMRSMHVPVTRSILFHFSQVFSVQWAE